MAAGAPFPWHIRLGSHYYKLATERDAGVSPVERLMFRRKAQSFFPPRISSSSATQAGFPPDSRVPYTFSVFSGGYGQPRQETTDATDRYYYGDARTGNTYEGTDPSLGDRVILGPLIGTYALPSFTPTDGYFLTIGTTLVLAATDGTDTKIFNWNAGALTWDLKQTISSVVVTDACAFKGTQASVYGYLACGESTNLYYSTDGITWTVTGAGNPQGSHLCVAQGKLVKSQAGKVTTATDGGTNPTFGGAIAVADALGTINWLGFHANRATVGKSNGLCVLVADTSSLDQNLWSDRAGNTADTLSWAGSLIWRDQLWGPVARGLYAISSGYLTQQVGITHIEDNDSRVTGRLTALAADDFHLYAVSSSGDLMKGVVTFEHGLAGVFVKSVAWYPVSYLGATTGLRAKVWYGTSGAAPELHLLLANGVVCRVILSATGNPLTDSRYRFAPGGVCYFPRFYAGYLAATKNWFSMTPDATNLATGATGQTIQTGYRTSLGSGWTDNALVQDTDPGRRDEPTTVPRSKWLDTRVTLVTGDATLTPQLRSLTVDSGTDPATLFEMTLTIDATEGALRNDGAAGSRLAPSLVRAQLESLIATGVQTFVDPYGQRSDVTVPLEGNESVAGLDHNNAEPQLFINVRLIEQKQRPAGTFAELATMTFAQLATKTFADLTTA